MIYGYLRETSEQAKKAGIDKTTNIPRTGLDEYLKVIFPNTTDWVHDKCFDSDIKELKLKRPDYRSESLKLIVEFDGLPHYTSPFRIKEDEKRVKLYEKYGYKVVRIPYFIQLTREAVKTLFDVDVGFELFDPMMPSLTLGGDCTPAYLCVDGIQRMANEFLKFPEQYKVNLEYMKNIPNEFSYLVRVDLLEYFINNKQLTLHT